MFKKSKISNFTGRINAFRVIERLERMNTLSGQNTESVKFLVALKDWYFIKSENLNKNTYIETKYMHWLGVCK